MILPELLSTRVIAKHKTSEALWLANLTHDNAAGYLITNELSTMTPYEIPQRFARHFDSIIVRNERHWFSGIRWRTRFDTGRAARGLALFDFAGERAWPTEISEIEGDVRAKLEAIVRIPRKPDLAELDRAELPIQFESEMVKESDFG